MNNGKHVAGGTPGKKKRTVLLIVCIILAALAVLAAVYFLWERPPELVTDNGTAQQQQTAKETPAPADGEVPDPDAETPEDDGMAEPLATGRSTDCYTFLLVGRDYVSNSTDTIIVGRLDTKAHTIHCINIPRDTLINISWSNTPKKINAVYPGYVNSGKDGIEGLRAQVKNLLGFDVDCYAVVSIKAVEEAVDCIGGVWFDVPVDMHYWDPTQDLDISIDKGYQLLDGENAVKVCRFRNTYAGGDIERIGVQQDFLRALAGQVLSVGNIPNLGELVNILMENTDTDLTAANIAWFARQFLLCDMENVTFQTMPWAASCGINGISFVSVDLNAWLDVINGQLNPYAEQVTAANVNILTCNANGGSMSATTGAIAGGADSFYCITCTVKNGGKATHHYPGACP